MKILTLLPVLFLAGSLGQNVTTSEDGSQVVVLSHKWSKSRLTVAQAESAIVPPPNAMIPANRTFGRNQRINASAGERDPNTETIEGRSAALERAVQAAREPKPIDGFSFRTRIRNNNPKAIEVIFWEYQFHDPIVPAQVSRRQFLCGVNIKPGKEKDLQGFSTLGPADVVRVDSGGAKTIMREEAVVNRVEYADGSIWQRKGWSFAEVKPSYSRVIQTAWHPDTCKGL
jgi:hypothetical protein